MAWPHRALANALIYHKEVQKLFWISKLIAHCIVCDPVRQYEVKKSPKKIKIHNILEN